jgi:23S rRNA (adenine2503-C2)-methyltransferase
MLYERRRTACISTQVGCPIRCDFCATGKSGFRRNLTAGEIVAQVILIARAAREFAPADARPLTNVVYMGMGEPLLNLDAVLKSLRILTDPKGFNLGDRHITISTAGVVPGILRLAQEPLQVRLALSLHAPNDALRDQLVPLNRRYPLAQVRQALQTYFEHTGRRITIEYALIKEVNDHKAQAAELAELFAGLPIHVNLIPVNPVENSPYRPSPPARVQVFMEELERHHIPCSVRVRRGLDVQAGCGQLRSRYLAQSSS